MDQPHPSRLSEPDRAAARAAAALLRDRLSFVSRVIVFGSRARGDGGPGSDLDLLVLTTRPVVRSERHAVTRALSPLGRELGVMFGTVVVSESDWERGVVGVLPLHAEIVRDGVAA